MTAPIMPMMAQEHFQVYLALAWGAGRDVFEWGSGGSTLALRAAGINVVSVDNDPEWAERTGAKLITDRDEYVRAVDDIVWPLWPVIMVDGRWRSRCLRAARSRIAKGGVVLLHDAQREYYHEAASEYDRILKLPPDAEGRELWILQ